jgi:hypothetical protein
LKLVEGSLAGRLRGATGNASVVNQHIQHRRLFANHRPSRLYGIGTGDIELHSLHSCEPHGVKLLDRGLSAGQLAATQVHEKALLGE